MKLSQADRGLARARLPCAAACLAFLAACGYRPAADVVTPGPLCVRGESVRVADPQAVAALEAGARQALARAGRLGECGKNRDLLVEIVRLDDVPEGILPSNGSVDARGERVVAQAHGEIVEPTTNGGRVDLGTLSVGVTYGYASDSAREVLVRDAARREAAWRAGQGIAERAMGVPQPSDPHPIVPERP